MDYQQHELQLIYSHANLNIPRPQRIRDLHHRRTETQGIHRSNKEQQGLIQGRTYYLPLDPNPLDLHYQSRARNIEISLHTKLRYSPDDGEYPLA